MPDADNFFLEKPSIRFDDDVRIIIEDPMRLQAVLEEFVGQDTGYPFAADRRGAVQEFLNSR